MYSVICFLNVKSVKSADIHRQICEVYGQNITHDGVIRKWVRAFRLVVKKGKENRCFTISSLSCEFPQASRGVIYEIFTEHLKYQKLCSLLTLGSKNADRNTKTNVWRALSYSLISIAKKLTNCHWGWDLVSLCYARIKTIIHGMATFIVIHKS